MKNKKKRIKGKGEMKRLDPESGRGRLKFGMPLWAWLLLIFIGAILLRVTVHIQASANDPAYNHIMQDELTYSNWAVSFSKGETPSPLPFAAPPFYAFVLGNFIYRFFGENYIAVYIFNNLLALLNIYLLFIIGRKAWNPRAGLIAAAVYNLYSPFMMLEFKVMATTLYLTLALLSVYWGMLARERNRPGSYFAAGLLMGLATITRPTFIFFLPFYLFWLLRTVKPVKAWLVAALIVIAGFVPPIIPVTATNIIGGKDFIPLTTTGGLNFYLGNSEYANAYYCFPPGIDASDLQLLHKTSKKVAELETGRQMKASEVSSFFMRKGMNYIRTQPLKWLRLLFWKSRALISNFEVGDVWDYYTTRESVPLLFWIGLPFAVVISLGVVGLVWTLGVNRRVSLLILALLSFAAYMLTFFISTRFRMPFAAMCCLFIGGGVSTFLRGSLSLTRIMGGVAAGIAVFLISLAPLTWIIGDAKILGGHYNMGTIYLQREEFEDAREEFRLELADNPYDAKSLAMLGLTEFWLGNTDAAEENFRKALDLGPNLAIVYTSYGTFLFENERWLEAESVLRRSIEINPDDPLPTLYLVDSLFRLGRSKEALDITERIPLEGPNVLRVLQLRGTIQLELNRAGDAAATFRKALEYDIEDPDIWYYLGLALHEKGDFAGALGAYLKVAEIDHEYPGLKLAVGDAWYAQGNYLNARDAYMLGLEIEPDSYELYHNLALAFGRLGNIDAAKESFLRAIELKPDYYHAFYNLGNLYIGQGNADEAIANLEKAIEIKPDFIPALLNLGTLYAQLEDYIRAREYWQKVITFAPNSSEAGIARNNLKALDE